MNEEPVERHDAQPAVSKPALPAAKPAAALVGMRKAVAAFAADCRKRFVDTNPGVAGAFIAGGKQYIVDRCIAVAYDKPFDGLETVDKGAKPVDANAILKDARVGKVLSLPALKDITAQYKQAKGKSRDYTQLTQLGNVYVNTAYLIRAMELLGIQGGKARNAGQFKPLYIEGNGCEAVVLPVRVTGAHHFDVWRPKLSA